MRKLVMCSAFFLVQIIFAQSKAIVKGSIKDAKIGVAIPFATVSFQYEKTSVLSDENYELISENEQSHIKEHSLNYQPWYFLSLATNLSCNYGTLLDDSSDANKISSVSRFTSTESVAFEAVNHICLGERSLIEDDFFLIKY